jgi:hypothetical protein
VSVEKLRQVIEFFGWGFVHPEHEGYWDDGWHIGFRMVNTRDALRGWLPGLTEADLEETAQHLDRLSDVWIRKTDIPRVRAI